MKTAIFLFFCSWAALSCFFAILLSIYEGTLGQRRVDKNQVQIVTVAVLSALVLSLLRSGFWYGPQE